MIGISPANTKASTTAYDPTCGSGSLLLKVAAQAGKHITLEYVVVHEMVHLIVPRHDVRFVALMYRHYPTWREARAELNELPLAAEAWVETRVR